MEHAGIKIAVMLIYAGLLGYATYKLLVGYVDRHNITECRNPMFADVLRGLIAVGISADIAMATGIALEVFR